VAESDEVRAIAEFYAKNAKKVIEPTKADIIESAKNYVVCRRLMEMEKCQGIAIDCLGWRNPVCLAFMKLRDEGIVAACEQDQCAAIGMLMTHLLFERPCFQQDPSPNTVNNTLIGAHCTSPSRLEGFGRSYRAPYLLRNYHTRTGVAPEVLWPEGKPVTVMQVNLAPLSIMVGAGQVVSNIAQPPSGCCRTSVEISLDGVSDTCDVKGFHQLFVLGRLERMLRTFGKLADIPVVSIC
jgi:L-fucose isomerase-like protein